jgi:hypothetical protein
MSVSFPLPFMRTKFLARIGSRMRRWAMLRTPFYRMYPYARPVSIFEVDRRVFVSRELQILFNGIGKAAHSSVVVSLAKAQRRQDTNVLDAKERTFVRPSQLPSDVVAQIGSYFKFSIVRNPYTRTLSAYLDKIARGKVVPKDLLRVSGGKPPSFLDFCRYLDQGGLYDGVHWAPQTSMLVIPLSELDFLGKMESFDHDLGVVFSRLGLEGRCAVARHDPHRTAADQKVADYYDDESRVIVRRLFMEDFRLLGYSADL